MDIVIWSLIILCFIVSFVGLVYPIIPAVLMIWAGAALYHFFIAAEIVWWAWTSLFLLTILIFIADYAASAYFVDKYKGSNRGKQAAIAGLILGVFILPPFGILIVPFVLVLITEVSQGKAFQEALKVAFGTLIAFLSSTFAKGLIQLAMIFVFFVNVIFF